MEILFHHGHEISLSWESITCQVSPLFLHVLYGERTRTPVRPASPVAYIYIKDAAKPTPGPGNCLLAPRTVQCWLSKLATLDRTRDTLSMGLDTPMDLLSLRQHLNVLAFVDNPKAFDGGCVQSPESFLREHLLKFQVLPSTCSLGPHRQRKATPRKSRRHFIIV